MKKILLITIGMIVNIMLNAQNVDLSKGHFSGSFESYTQLYKNDDVINAVAPPSNIASNNFLKIDYSYDKFVAGIQ